MHCFRANEPIVEKGEPCAAVFLIIEGGVVQHSVGPLSSTGGGAGGQAGGGDTAAETETALKDDSPLIHLMAGDTIGDRQFITGAPHTQASTVCPELFALN